MRKINFHYICENKFTQNKKVSPHFWNLSPTIVSFLKEPHRTNWTEQSEIFHCRRGFLEWGHFGKYLIHNTQKKDHALQISESLLVGILKTAFWMRNLSHRWKKVIFVNFQKRAVKAFLPSPSYVNFEKWILKASLYVYHTCANSYATTIAQNYFTTKLVFNSCNSVLSEVGGYSICEACFCNNNFG